MPLDGYCSRCGATADEPCRDTKGQETYGHRVRNGYLPPTAEEIESRERAARRRAQWAEWDARQQTAR